MRRTLLLTLWAVLAIGSAPGAPLKRSDAPANPSWIFHIDCDALRHTYLGKYLLYQLNKPEMNSNMIAFQSVFSFDVRTQVHALTFFSDGPTVLDTVSILYADYVPAQLIKSVEATKNPRKIHFGSHVIYDWIESGAKIDDGTRKFTAFEDKRAVAGKSKRALTTALDVLDGSAPSLASSDAWPKLGHGDRGTFLQGVARSTDFISADPQLQLLKSARRLEINAREVDEHLTVVLTADMPDAAAAAEMKLVTESLVALLRLQREHPQILKVADALSIRQDGARVTATLDLPSTDFVAAWKEYNSIKIKPQGRR